MSYPYLLLWLDWLNGKLTISLTYSLMSVFQPFFGTKQKRSKFVLLPFFFFLAPFLHVIIRVQETKRRSCLS